MKKKKNVALGSVCSISHEPALMAIVSIPLDLKSKALNLNLNFE